MTRENPWYRITNVDELDSPALVVYPARVRQNIAAALGLVRGAALLRPHVKTHKSPDVTQLCLAAGITKFKCATIAEAEMLARCGAPDVLLAYPPIGPKVHRLRLLREQYSDTLFSCTVDDERAALVLSEAFGHGQQRLPVFIDINVGMNRTGTRTAEAAERLFTACRAMPGLAPAGLHAYDGHVNDPDPDDRARHCQEAFTPVFAVWDRLNAASPRPVSLVGGGSPTFPILAARGDIECSPGTFIYWDRSYESTLREMPFVPAALVVTRVISHPAPDTLCLDLGHKSVAAEKDIRHRVHFLNAPGVDVIAQSEEHLIVHTSDTSIHPVGEVWYGLPYHICPTCALYERAATVADGRVDGEWEITARNRRLGI